MKNSPIFILCLVVRWIHALILRTSFAPDEYWQGPEVAHRMVFGYGHLTWEWAAGLRSYLHPSLYAIFYWILKAVHIDHPFLIAKGPQLLQASFAALTDLAVYKISLFMHGTQVARWTLLCQLLAWFNAYSLVRTYSSSVEACLTTLGIMWLILDIEQQPSSKTSSSSKHNTNHIVLTMPSRYRMLWMIMAACSITIRPPSGLFWSCIAVWYVYRWCVGVQAKGKAMVHGIAIGSSVLGLCIGLDFLFYKRLVIAFWNFFLFNFLSGGSSLYGDNPWHWNFTCNMPSILASYIILVWIGIRQTTQRQGRELRVFFFALLQMIVYSLSSHKEHRFLLPALQCIIPYCGLGAAVLSSTSSLSVVSVVDKKKGRIPKRKSSSSTSVVLICIFVVQVIMAVFFGIFHQRAQISVIEHLRHQHTTSSSSSPSPPLSILFLTPCHTTPYYSYIHQNISMRFLDCSPPGWETAVYELNKKEMSWLLLPPPQSSKGDASIDSKRSQRQVFESDPVGYLKSVFKLNKKKGLPRLIVGYSQLMKSKQMAALLKGWGYSQKEVLNNCWIQTDENNECSIDVWWHH